MRGTRKLKGALALVLLGVLVFPVTAAANHGPLTGHLIGTGEFGKVDLVGSVEIEGVTDDLIADVAVFGDYAYLANWGSPDCPSLDAIPGNEKGGRKASDAGVYVIDISDLENPEEVGFIPMSQDVRPGEGLQVIHIDTPRFTGDVLAVNEEGCGKNQKGGFSLWDVTNPLKPVKLAKNFGDFTMDGMKNTPRDANHFHSVFIWDAGDKAYLVATDNMEVTDVDIFDITNPKRPVHIADLDLNDYNLDQPALGLTDSFLHDMVVKQINGTWYMLLSYWDGGFVIMDVDDPANPVFVADTDFPPIDPLLLEMTGQSLPPEGNAHQAEWTIDNRFIVGSDEDFAPYKLFLSVGGGPAEPLSAGVGTGPLIEAGQVVTGSTTFLGLACTPGSFPNAGAGVQIAVIERGTCDFQVKIDNAEAAGYDHVFIFNSTTGVPPCDSVLGMLATIDIPAYFVGRSVGYEMLGIDGYNPANCPAGSNPPLPAVGTAGESITLNAAFDGWGYVHLFDANTLQELDQYAIPESMDPDFATGFGDLSVHEVATDPLDPTLVWVSYYSGGVRLLRITCPSQTTTAGCQLVEVGGYVGTQGSDIWGIQTFVRDGQSYALASDRDYGLLIFRDP